MSFRKNKVVEVFFTSQDLGLNLADLGLNLADLGLNLAEVGSHFSCIRAPWCENCFLHQPNLQLSRS